MYPFSVHVFTYYDDTGKFVLNRLKEFYSGPIYLSLVNGNKNNDSLLTEANSLFDVLVTYIDNYGTDQAGFYNTFKKDNLKTPWILYLHDKSNDKKSWLEDLINPLKDVNTQTLYNENIGIISAAAHKHQTYSINELLKMYGNIDFQYRKNLVQSMCTTLWLKELQRILLEKHNIFNEKMLFPPFCAGNIFFCRREIIQKAHDCVCENFFNIGYKSDGEVEHGLERFYFYVSMCMNYHNLFI